MIDALSAQAQHLKPIVDQVQPADWVSKGASETYVAQWNAAQAQIKYLISSSDAFSRQPERLPLGLDTYFRMQAVDSTLGFAYRRASANIRTRRWPRSCGM